jgi:hypothetical protein
MLRNKGEIGSAPATWKLLRVTGDIGAAPANQDVSGARQKHVAGPAATVFRRLYT